MHSLLVETPTRRFIVDTCIGNDKQGRNVPTWNNLKLPFIEDLTKAGYPPESIDTVFCTHLHVDHVGWNTKLVNGKWVPTFENARYIFVKPEYEHWRDHATVAVACGDVRGFGQADHGRRQGRTGGADRAALRGDDADPDVRVTAPATSASTSSRTARKAS